MPIKVFESWFSNLCGTMLTFRPLMGKRDVQHIDEASYLRIKNLLLEVAINARGIYHRTPLILASEHGKIEVANILQKEGADITSETVSKKLLSQHLTDKQPQPPAGMLELL
ncbi:hypothetical protein HOY80DRAFT_1132820 [Tuber brumale]|nr:hypothetical protein HOY80DRAFT_1132820 [Tuber brumale]